MLGVGRGSEREGDSETGSWGGCNRQALRRGDGELGWLQSADPGQGHGKARTRQGKDTARREHEETVYW